jgi:S-DNA-T family DNA segregation ATPase FtsK/SpoIIIE
LADEKLEKKDRNFKQDLALLFLTALCLYVLLSLISYSPTDDGWSGAGSESSFSNAGGPVGAYISDGLLHGLGYLSFIVPLLAAGKILQIFRNREIPHSHLSWFLRLSGFFLSILSLAALLDLSIFTSSAMPAGSGGIIGQALGGVFVGLFGTLGGGIMLTLILCIGMMLFWEFSWLAVFDALGLTLLKAMRFLTGKSKEWLAKQKDVKVNKQQVTAPASIEKKQLRIEPSLPEVKESLSEKLKQQASKALPPVLKEAIPTLKEVKIEPLAKREVKPSERAVRDLQGSLFSEENPLPSIALLDPADENQKAGYSKVRLEELSAMLEQKLADFGVKAEVVAVAPGPVITRFEIQPAPGTKASKVSGIAQDLARSMAMNSVRVVEVIPGKSVMGIEIPNENRAMVRLSSVLSAEDFDKSKSPLTMALGHDIAGNPVVTDLAKMPHLLVAGTTGSGKSVGVNAMIISLLYKSTPDEVRLIMVDPKMLELSVYEGIPHLLTPVITDMKEAANGLRWSVEEMERRYQLMAALGVRNVAGYNAKVKAAIAEDKPIPDPLWQIDQSFDTTPPTLKPLPYIVVVVDEFADMMMTVGKKVEELIARIAQKARAAGIHLILATQRPSVDVITGLIKANVPTRIAFQVSSKIDSRTIIDQGGAEQLLGHGDMLFQPAGTSIPIRVHGAFVDDDEVHRVVAEWKTKGEPNYIEEITQSSEQAGLSLEGGDEKDDLYDQAVAFVTETRKVSISSVQRKLRIGYNRAARLVETMEAGGVVSPAAHNGSREVIAPPPVNH